MNEIKVAFSSEFNLDLAEFVEVWNNTPECREIAEARLNQLAKTQFTDPSFMASVVEFVASTGSVEFATGAIAGIS